MKYRAVVVDCELTSRQTIRSYLAQDADLELVAEAATGTEALVALLHHRPDIVVLSLQLPRLDGVEVLKEIWPHCQPQLVLLTEADSPLLLALEASGVPCLPKPYSETYFHQTLSRVKTNLAQAPPLQPADALLPLLLSEEPAPSRAYLRRLLVKEQHKLFFVKVQDILYFDADGNYITLHTLQRTYTLYESLTQLEQRLDPADFTRIHRSFLINLNYVEELESYFNGEYLVRLTGGHTLKWTRFYRDNVKAFLTKSR